MQLLVLEGSDSHFPLWTLMCILSLPQNIATWGSVSKSTESSAGTWTDKGKDNESITRTLSWHIFGIDSHKMRNVDLAEGFIQIPQIKREDRIYYQSPVASKWLQRGQSIIGMERVHAAGIPPTEVSVCRSGKLPIELIGLRQNVKSNDCCLFISHSWFVCPCRQGRRFNSILAGMFIF